MQTLDEQIEKLITYLNKLRKIVNNEKSFSFGSVKIVSKAKIDDVLCCIQASYPQDYQDYVKRNGIKSLQSHLNFQQIVNIATKKFMLSGDHYSIDSVQLEKLLGSFSQIVKIEMKNVIKDNNFKL